MPLFRRRSGKQHLRRSADTFTLSDSHKIDTLCLWVRQQTALGKCVMVLSHFQSSFLQNQAALQCADIEFDILAQPLDQHEFVRSMTIGTRGRVILTMAQMLQPVAPEATSPVLSPRVAPTPGTGQNDTAEFSIIVTERYPITANDDNLIHYLQSTGLVVSLGYLISFEDPILRHLLGDQFISLLKQLGLGDQDLISSTMTHRRLTRQLIRATQAVDSPVDAESPSEWIRLNL